MQMNMAQNHVVTRRSALSRNCLTFCAGLFALASLATAAESGETSFKFAFGPGNPDPGYKQVLPTTAYTDALGYGIDLGSKAQGVDRDGKGLLTSDKPFFFSVAVPEGNYKVTVTLGDPAGESTTTVKAELRRLMIQHLHTDAGKLETRSFIVNVRTPKIAGGGEVHLKSPREVVNEAVAWDNKLTLEFNDARPCISKMEIEKVDVPTVFILGDSTVCDQSGEPFASWGQMITRFFKPEVAVANHAESGETLASSQGAHRLDKVLSLMKQGDYLLVQFGHNDMKSKDPNAPQTYKATLKKWVALVKEKGGTPILITPMNRHSFQGDTITNSLKEYPDMVREAAREENVTLIDLNAMSKTLYETMGPKPSIMAFEHNADASKFDGTHHSPYGAYELAQCVIDGIRRSGLPLAQSIVDDVVPFDPAKPDVFADFNVPVSPGFTNQRPLGD